MVKIGTRILRLVGVASICGLSGCNPPPAPALASPAAAQLAAALLQAGTIKVGAVSGLRQRVNFLSAINPDCTSTGEVHPFLTSPPSHGNVTFAAANDFPYFVPPNIRVKCNGQRVPGLVVYYQSAVDYHGQDEFVLNVVYSNGGFLSPKFVVVVP